MDHDATTALDGADCLRCGGTLGAMRFYCLDCGHSPVRRVTSDAAASPPAPPRATGSLAGRLTSAGTGLLRMRSGGTGLLGSRTGRAET